MKYMMLVKSPENMKSTPALYEAIGKMAQELFQTGVMVEMGGLAPSARGARIRLAQQKLTVTDGPFTETKELVGGFAVLKADSKTEAIELGRRFMQVHADHLGSDHVLELEIREMTE